MPSQEPLSGTKAPCAPRACQEFPQRPSSAPQGGRGRRTQHQQLFSNTFRDEKQCFQVFGVAMRLANFEDRQAPRSPQSRPQSARQHRPESDLFLSPRSSSGICSKEASLKRQLEGRADLTHSFATISEEDTPTPRPPQPSHLAHPLSASLRERPWARNAAVSKNEATTPPLTPDAASTATNQQPETTTCGMATSPATASLRAFRPRKPALPACFSRAEGQSDPENRSDFRMDGLPMRPAGTNGRSSRPGSARSQRRDSLSGRSCRSDIVSWAFQSEHPAARLSRPSSAASARSLGRDSSAVRDQRVHSPVIVKAIPKPFSMKKLGYLKTINHADFPYHQRFHQICRDRPFSAKSFPTRPC